MQNRPPGRPAHHIPPVAKMRLAQARARVAQLGAWVYGSYAWFVFALIFLCYGGIVMLLRRPPLGRRVMRVGARLVLRLAGVPYSVEGLDHLPTTPHVLLVNHGSFLDSIALTALLPSRPGYAFAVRQEFPAQRLLCPFLRGLGTLVLENARRKRRARNVARMTATLQRGDNLVIFPEGGFVRASGLMPFHSGAFVAAANAGVPIVVTGLRGARAALPPKTWLPHRVPISLKIGPVFKVHEKDPDALTHLIADARKAMMLLSGESEAAPTARSSAGS